VTNALSDPPGSRLDRRVAPAPIEEPWLRDSAGQPHGGRSAASLSTPVATPVRVVLADADDRVRGGLRRALAADGRLEVVREVSDGAALLALLPAISCDAVLLGLDLPGRSGLQVLAQLSGKPNRPVIVVLSIHDDASNVDRALALGAQVYILKSAAAAEIIGAVLHAVAGGVYLQPIIARAVVQRHLLLAGSSQRSLGGLSPRQLELLRALAIGMTNKEIAHLLDLSQGTVNDYMTDLFTRLGVASRAGAVSTGMRRGHIV